MFRHPLALNVFVTILFVLAMTVSPSSALAGWVSSGSSGGVTHYANYVPDTYYVRARAYDTFGNYSAFSPKFLVTLIYPPLSATCSASPASGTEYTGRPITWTVNNVKGGNRSYTYLWSGDGGLSGTGVSTTMSYATGGIKTASIRVTSAGNSSTFSCTTNVLSRPDLFPSDTTISPSPSVVGEIVTFSATATNNGPGPATAFPNMFQINDSASTTVSGTPVNATTIPSLAVGASGTVSKAYTFATAGTYYVRVCVNVKIVDAYGSWGGSILEENTSNNCGAWKEITIYPAISASCSALPISGTPLNGIYTSNIFKWEAVAAGGDDSYAYSWSGGGPSVVNDGLTDTHASTTMKKYSTPGTTAYGNAKTADINVTSVGVTKTFHCEPRNVLPIADLTATAAPILTPSYKSAGSSGMVGRPVVFSGIVSNAGPEATGETIAAFPNVFQVTNTRTGETKRVSATLLPGYPALNGLAVNNSTTVFSVYMFNTSDSYTVSICANFDTSTLPDGSWGGSILEANTGNNCSNPRTIDIYPPIVASCSVAPASGTISTEFQWNAYGVDGGDGSYTYKWKGGPGSTDSFPKAATNKFVRKTYSTVGTGIKVASTTIKSMGYSTEFACDNSATITSDVLIDSCGGGSGTTPQNPEPTGILACGHGTLNASSPVDTALLWKWTCGTVNTCSAPKYGCTTTTDTNYNATGPANTYACALTCANGATDYPTCTPFAAFGVLTIPSSCIIAIGASTCVVKASWDISNTVDAYLFDANPYVSGILYGQGVGYISSLPGWDGHLPNGHVDPPVYVAYPSTTFELKNGDGTTLDSKTVNADCAPGSAWDDASGTCLAVMYSCTGLPAHAHAFPSPDNTGLTANTPYAYSDLDHAETKCEFNCSNGYNWDSNACVPNTLSISCVGSPGNPYVGQQVTWRSSVSGGAGPYTYSWIGDGMSSSDTTAVVTKSYDTAGIKQATVAATDSTTGASGSANCTTGSAQLNGPITADTGGIGVSVGNCQATLTANPNALSQGNNTALTWSVTGGALCASSCSGGGENGFNTGGAISGANVPASYMPTPPSTTYSLTCTAGTYGPPPTTYATVVVAIDAPVVTVNGQTGTPSGAESATDTGIVTVLVDPVAQPVNNVTITWEPPLDTTIDSCSITKNGLAWQRGLGPSGSITTTATTKTTYVVDCQKRGPTGIVKHATKTILVNVLLNYKEF